MKALSRRRFIFLSAVSYRLFRLPNILIIFLTQYFTRLFLAGPQAHWKSILLDKEMFLLVCSTAFIAMAGYVINDYYDVKIDSINRPRRIVIDRFLTRRQAIMLHLILNFSGILFGYLVDWRIAIVNFGAAFLLWIYSNLFKRIALVGNILVSALTALSVYVVAIFVQGNYLLILTYAVFAFFISLVREIIKDMEDLKGDSTFGCKTLPVLFGIKKTKNILYIILSCFFIILSAMGYILKIEPLYFIIIIFIPLFYLSYLLLRADKRKDFTFLSILCKMIMLGGIFSMIFI